MGRVMRRKTRVELWKDALNRWQRPVPEIEGIGKDVFAPLKLSYESLEGKSRKQCFLCCSLFPEDFNIEINELIQCWIAEGLLDEPKLEDSLCGGIALIESLKDSCLLEGGVRENYVKMHDIVRDVAIWIASSEDETKSFIEAGRGLSQIPEAGKWKSPKKVSFMNNRITVLPDSTTTQCSEVSTLLLQRNPIERVPEVFLLGFQALRVLNLSETPIRTLPHSLNQLSELRALLLAECSSLEVLPPLGGLSRLQVLNLSSTGIRELPKGFEKLSNLRQLNLSYTKNLKTVQAITISRLSSLEELSMSYSSYFWDENEKADGRRATLKELGCLKSLSCISIKLENIPSLALDLTFLERLTRFHLYICPNDYDMPSMYTDYDGKTVSAFCIDLSEGRLESVESLLRHATALGICECMGRMRIFENQATNGAVVGFTGLRSLTIWNCDLSESNENHHPGHELVPNLEELEINYLRGLNLYSLMKVFCLKFSRLKVIEVVNCSGPEWKCLFPSGSITKLENLEEIGVLYCDSLEVIFEELAIPDALPKLQTLMLILLPKLLTVCSNKTSLPCIQWIDVHCCPELRKLPLSSQNINTIKEINGEEEWWEQLELADSGTKLSLQSYFQLETKKIPKPFE